MSECFGPGAARLTAVAAQMLGWTPDQFWDATPAELASALGMSGEGGDAALGKDELAMLMARFPDKGTENGG